MAKGFGLEFSLRNAQDSTKFPFNTQFLPRLLHTLYPIISLLMASGWPSFPVNDKVLRGLV